MKTKNKSEGPLKLAMENLDKYGISEETKRNIENIYEEYLGKKKQGSERRLNWDLLSKKGANFVPLH